jgi:putative MATE family efflux protein
MDRDLTKGSVLANLLAMSLPTMFGYLVLTLYDLVDLFWIGKLANASAAIAGFTIFAQLMWIIEILNEVIGISSVSLISQSYGAGRFERTRVVIEQTLVFKALVALVAGLLGFVILRPVVSFYSGDGAVIEAALGYGRIRILTLPLAFSSYTVNTALRNIGDAKKPMLILAFSSIVNIILDPLFMFKRVPYLGVPGLGLGIFGAALATVIAIGLSVVLGLWFLFSGRSRIRLTFRGLLRLDPQIDRQLITVGLPAGAEMLVRNGAQAVVLKLTTLFGTPALTAMGIVFRLFGFGLMPLLGLHMGAGTMAGQNLGAEQLDRVRASCRAAVLTGLAIMAALGVLTWVFAAPILGLFTAETAIITLAIPLLRVFCVSLLFIACTFGLGAVFSGAGYNVPFLVSSLSAKFGFQVPLLLLMLLVFRAPVQVVWFSFLGTELIEAVVVLLYYRAGRWKTARV